MKNPLLYDHIRRIFVTSFMTSLFVVAGAAGLAAGSLVVGQYIVSLPSFLMYFTLAMAVCCVATFWADWAVAKWGDIGKKEEE